MGGFDESQGDMASGEHRGPFADAGDQSAGEDYRGGAVGVNGWAVVVRGVADGAGFG